MLSENLHTDQGGLGGADAGGSRMVPGSLHEAGAILRRILDEERAAACYWCGLALGVLIAALAITLIVLT